MKIFLNQSKAEIIRMFRNPYFVFWSLLMPLVFYFIFTRMLNIDVPDKAVWDAHFLMSVTCFSVMGSSIMTLGIGLVEERKQGWMTYLRVTPLSTATYFAAKMVGQSLVHVFSILLIFSVGGIVNSISLSVKEWLLSGSWILLGSLTFLSLGTVVGTMKKVETATGVSNFIYLILAILGGLWMPMDILPKILQNIGNWLPGFHYGNGAWEIIRGDLPEIKNISVLSVYSVIFMLLSIYIRRKQEIT